MSALLIQGLMGWFHDWLGLYVLEGPHLNPIVSDLLLEFSPSCRSSGELNTKNMVDKDSLCARTFNLVCLFRLAALSFKPVQSSSWLFA